MLDRILGRMGYRKAAELKKPPGWLVATGVEEQYSLPMRDSYESQLDLYQKLTWVQIAIGAVARIVASTSLEVVKMEGEDEVAIPNHPFETLLKAPNPLFSRFELLQATVSYLCLTGNAYWWLNRAGKNAPVEEIWVLPGNRISPVPDGNMYLRGYMYETDQKQEPLETWEVVHFRLFNPMNSFIGLSPLQSLATVATGDMAMSKYNTAYFDKNNAKVPGALAFADPIDDDTWLQMKKETAQEYGGTRRRLMMLRNVGTGGVSWIPMALSQADMQFLEGRKANKEEIFALFAPGLASVLDVNATEANSLAGRATFIELGVWPILSLIAEKISNDLLLAFGEESTAKFQDIRVTDKQMELEEIKSFSAVHTVDEVRARWFKADPIGDDRGRLLVPEVTKGFTVNPPDVQEREDERAAAAFEQQQAALTTAAGDNAAPGGQDQPPNSDLGLEAEEEKAAEAKAFRKWLKNRVGKADPTRFKARYLSTDEILQIYESQEVSKAVHARFPFYP